MNKEKKESRFMFFMDKILNLEAIFESGKYLFLLILLTMTIIFWLDFCASFPRIIIRVILYSVTPLIPIYIAKLGFESIFKSGAKKDE